MKKRIIIKEEDYDMDYQKEWEKSVIVICWEHNYEDKIYIIDYKNK